MRRTEFLVYTKVYPRQPVAFVPEFRRKRTGTEPSSAFKANSFRPEKISEKKIYILESKVWARQTVLRPCLTNNENRTSKPVVGK